MIEAKIVADSIGPAGVRLTTFLLVYPRFIHSELMTHRVFSRNASSSRAIPVSRQIEMVKTNPAIPLDFRKNQKGMQAGELLEDQDAAVKLWLEGRDRAVEIAERMSAMEIHKQYANRVMEPYAHIMVVLTATDFNNFFALRIHTQAQPEICELASQAYKLYSTNIPARLEAGDWHLPFIDKYNIDQAHIDCKKVDLNGRSVRDWVNQVLIERSVAKCARTSYANHDGSRTSYEQDKQLYDRLLGSNPIHASPAEHQAMAIGDASVRSGNFRGWIQYRKTLANENITEYNGRHEG